MDVHHPYVPPEKHQLAFRDEAIDKREAIRFLRKMLENPNNLSTSEQEDIIDLYDAEIRFTDAEIGRLIQTARQELNDPVIIITADHGEELNDHGRYSHNETYYDELIHVPLLVQDGTSASDQDDLVGLIDISPTLTDYADVPPADAFYGESLRPIITGDRTSDHVSSHNYCRTAEWKYIHDGSAKGNELYDLSDDPEELTNISQYNEDVVSRLHKEVD